MAGFNLDASVAVKGGDRTGLERLAKYILRPGFSLERLSKKPDGRLAYALRRPAGTELLLTPLELMGRLTTLIPPPYLPTVKYHGLFAPSSPWRCRVVPVSTGKKARHGRTLMASPGGCTVPVTAPADIAGTQGPLHPPTPLLPVGNITPGPQPVPSPPEPSLPPASPLLLLSAAATWAAMAGMRLSRYGWADLLKRIYDIDALACPRCDGRLTFIAVLTQPPMVHAMLQHLGLPADPPELARARDPTSPIDLAN